MTGMKDKIRISRDTYEKAVLLAAVTAGAGAADAVGGDPVKAAVAFAAIAAVLFAGAAGGVKLDRHGSGQPAAEGTGDGEDGSDEAAAGTGADEPGAS